MYTLRSGDISGGGIMSKLIFLVTTQQWRTQNLFMGGVTMNIIKTL